MSAALFVDGAAARIEAQMMGVQIECSRLKAWAQNLTGTDVAEAYWFDATSTGIKNGFHRALNQNGVRVRIHEISDMPLFINGRQVYDNYGDPIVQRKQVGVDVALALELMRSHHRRKWNTLVLVAGDGDLFTPVKELAETYGVRIILVGAARSRSHMLVPFAAECIDFSKAAGAICRRNHSLRVVEKIETAI